MNFTAIIPARYASTRFPGKPLVMIDGKMMIQRVYEQALHAFEQVYVATDDNRIRKAVESFGGKCVMTSADHKSGTDRCAEAAKISANEGIHTDVVVNIQGDEPFIQPDQLEKLKSCFRDDNVQIATLVKPIDRFEDIVNSNLPKVVFTNDKYAIYFSRSPIPFVRGQKQQEWNDHHQFYRHIGLYAYRFDILNEITQLAPSSLERAESLEQNRWIENGYKIKVELTQMESIGIDTPDDLKRLKNISTDRVKFL